MKQLVITRGIPASGKTTWARAWVAEDETNRARVNRDDLRQTLYGRDAPLPYELEEALTVAQRAAVRALLVSGRSVVVDDMHLNAKYVKAWQQIAAATGAEFAIQSFRDVQLATCLRRDRERGEAGGRLVGEEFIREAHQRLRSSGEIDLTKEKPDRYAYRYFPRVGAPAAFLFDIDGTLSLMKDRGPFEWSRVGEDSPNEPVAYLALYLWECGFKIVLMSGRDSVCRDETVEWLKSNAIPCHDLFMRPAGDHRKDSEVKLELFRAHVAERYNVRGVFDDRDQVVALWRSIGLQCYQVAPGAF